MAALLIATTLYLVFEWKQSSRKARELYWSLARAGFTTLFACVSLWLSHPLIAANTGFASVSPGWFFGFMIIGFFLGGCVSVVILSSLMIRTTTEAKALQLRRIPIATHAIYITYVPIIILLFVVFYVLRHYSPDIIKEFWLEFILTCVPLMLAICEKFAWLCLSQDESGNRIPLAKRTAQLKEVYDSHDYSYYLIDRGSDVIKDVGIDQTAPPQEVQKDIQEKYSVMSQSILFHVELKNDIGIELYSKDDNNENKSLRDTGVRIKNRNGKNDFILANVQFDVPKKESQEVEIPIALLERHAEEYLSTHADDTEFDIKKIVSHAVNESALEIIAEDGGPFLHKAVLAGLENQVKELLKQDIDVNEQAAAGWTALLYASAQGYSTIAKLLLDAGANPNIGNVHKITPLMYGARYDNLDICRLLIEYGADTDLQDIYGSTALIIATTFGHIDVVEELIKVGANTTIKDKNDMTALDVAHHRKQGKIAKKLRRSAKQA